MAGREQLAGVPVDDRPDVHADLRVVGQVGAQLTDHQLGVERARGCGRARGGDAAPVAHVRLHLLPPRGVGPLLQHRQQRLQRLRRVAGEPDLDGVAVAQVSPVEVHLHAARLARRGVELGPGSLVPTISSVSQEPSRCALAVVPRWPMTPAANGSDSSTYGLPSRLVVMPAPRRSATATTSSRAPRAPWPTSRATRRPALSTSAAARRSCVVRQDARRPPARRRHHDRVLLGLLVRVPAAAGCRAAGPGRRASGSRGPCGTPGPSASAPTRRRSRSGRTARRRP